MNHSNIDQQRAEGWLRRLVEGNKGAKTADNLTGEPSYRSQTEQARPAPLTAGKLPRAEDAAGGRLPVLPAILGAVLRDARPVARVETAPCPGARPSGNVRKSGGTVEKSGNGKRRRRGR